MTKKQTNDNEHRELWAVLRAAHEEALTKVAAEDYDGWGALDPRPGAKSPFAERIDWLTYALYCEGFIQA